MGSKLQISSPVFKRMDFGLTRAGFHLYFKPTFQKVNPELSNHWMRSRKRKRQSTEVNFESNDGDIALNLMYFQSS